MKFQYVFLAAALTFAPIVACAQNSVQQSGSVLKNRAAKWSAQGTVQDAGPWSGGGPNVGISDLPIVNTGTPLCIYDAPVTNSLGYHALCLGANSSGNGGLITYSAGGAAAAADLNFNINGVLYPFPGPGNGNIMGPNPTAINNVVCWNSLLGTLAKDCGGVTATFSLGAGTPSRQVFDPLATNLNIVKFDIVTSGAAASASTDVAGSALLWYRNTGNMTGLGVNHGISLAEFDYNDSGATVNNDSFVGVTGNCNLLTTRPNAGIGGGTLSAACIGGQFAARGIASQGGNLAAGQPQGEVHGLNVVSGVTAIGPSTPSDYVDHEGIEIDMVSCVGCTSFARIGLYIVDFGNGSGGLSEQGTTIDAAIAIGGLGGAVGWRYGIDFSGPPLSLGFPLANNGTVLGSSASVPVNALYGIDLNNFNIPANNPAFAGPGLTWYVTAAGNELANSVTAKSLIADDVNASASILEFRDSGVAIWDITRVATTDALRIAIAGGSTIFDATITGIVTLGVATTPQVILDPTGHGYLKAVPTVAAGTGKHFVCVDSATGELFRGTGASCN